MDNLELTKHAHKLAVKLDAYREWLQEQFAQFEQERLDDICLAAWARVGRRRRNLTPYETGVFDQWAIQNDTAEFAFDELPDAVQQDVYDRYLFWDVEDSEWWDCCYDDFSAKLAAAGFFGSDFYFELGRGQYIQCINLVLSEPATFLKWCGRDLRKKENRCLYDEEHPDYCELYATKRSYGLPGNKLDTNYLPLPGADVDDLNGRLYDLMQSFLKTLQEEYDYLTSEEHLRDRFSDDPDYYKFDLDGRMVR